MRRKRRGCPSSQWRVEAGRARSLHCPGLRCRACAARAKHRERSGAKAMANIGCARVERPRERLLALGAAALTDAELVAVLLRTGVRARVRSMSRAPFSPASTAWPGFSPRRVAEIAAVRGVGPAKGAELATVRRARAPGACPGSAASEMRSPRPTRCATICGCCCPRGRTKCSSACSSTARTGCSPPTSCSAARSRKPASIRARSSRPRSRTMPRR